MQTIKFFMLFLVFIASTFIGRFLSKKYTYSLEELEEFKNALNIFKAKIKFTYEPIPEIFDEISKNTNPNISKIFLTAKEKMKKLSAEEAWKKAIEESQTYLNKEDIHTILMLSKMLGQTDVEGQVSQIEVTESFLATQIKQAQEEKMKNEKLYSRLGTTIGLIIVIILI